MYGAPPPSVCQAEPAARAAGDPKRAPRAQRGKPMWQWLCHQQRPGRWSWRGQSQREGHSGRRNSLCEAWNVSKQGPCRQREEGELAGPNRSCGSHEGTEPGRMLWQKALEARNTGSMRTRARVCVCVSTPSSFSSVRPGRLRIALGTRPSSWRSPPGHLRSRWGGCAGGPSGTRSLLRRDLACGLQDP